MVILMALSASGTKLANEVKKKPDVCKVWRRLVTSGSVLMEQVFFSNNCAKTRNSVGFGFGQFVMGIGENRTIHPRTLLEFVKSLVKESSIILVSSQPFYKLAKI